MLIRSLTCLAVAALLSMLAPAPAQAQIEIVKFQGWMWNQTGGVITVQRVTSQCWDPQQLAYQQIQPNALWNFATESDHYPTCASGFISANVFDQNNTLLFWFQIVDNFVVDSCYIYLFYPGGTTLFNILPPMACDHKDTISYTMYVSGPAPAVAIVTGLQPMP
jgi:hypothetical protein